VAAGAVKNKKSLRDPVIIVTGALKHVHDQISRPRRTNLYRDMRSSLNLLTVVKRKCDLTTIKSGWQVHQLLLQGNGTLRALGAAEWRRRGGSFKVVASGAMGPESVKQTAAPATPAQGRMLDPAHHDPTSKSGDLLPRRFRVRQVRQAWPFDHPQFTLGRKVPLGDALIVAAHKRRGSGLGQGEEFLRRFQLTT
jgi:hypothetical protein